MRRNDLSKLLVSSNLSSLHGRLITSFLKQFVVWLIHAQDALYQNVVISDLVTLSGTCFLNFIHNLVHKKLCGQQIYDDELCRYVSFFRLLPHE